MGLLLLGRAVVVGHHLGEEDIAAAVGHIEALPL